MKYLILAKLRITDKYWTNKSSNERRFGRISMIIICIFIMF